MSPYEQLIIDVIAYGTMILIFGIIFTTHQLIEKNKTEEE